MEEIDSYKTASGTWVLFNDNLNKVINVVLVRNNISIFLTEEPEFYDCPNYFLNAVSQRVLREPAVIGWLLKRYVKGEIYE